MKSKSRHVEAEAIIAMSAAVLIAALAVFAGEFRSFVDTFPAPFRSSFAGIKGPPVSLVLLLIVRPLDNRATVGGRHVTLLSSLPHRNAQNVMPLRMSS